MHADSGCYGNLALLSQQGCAAQLAERGTEVVMSPYPDMGSKIALVAWMVLEKFDEFDEQRIKDFINAHMNSTRAPERWAE